MKDNFLKFYLQTTLGGFGTFLYMIIQALMVGSLFVPLFFLDLSSWWGYAGLIILLCLPLWGSILDVVLYYITFPTVIAEPFSFRIVLYYISLAVFLLTTVLPVFIDIIISVADMISRHRNS